MTQSNSLQLQQLMATDGMMRDTMTDWIMRDQIYIAGLKFSRGKSGEHMLHQNTHSEKRKYFSIRWYTVYKNLQQLLEQGNRWPYWPNMK